MSYDFKLKDGDIAILSTGEPGFVRDDAKLIQDILKMLFTPTGESTVHPWYGTPLLSRAVGNSFDTEILATEIQTAVQYGLNNILTLQQLQQQDNQFMTPREQISKIQDIRAELDPTDQRKLVVTVEIISKSNDLVTESIIVAV